MPTFNSISNIDGRTCVRLELDVTGSLTKSLITSINGACDSVEDAGEGAALLVLLHSKHGADHTDIDTVDVALVNQWERALRRIERLNAVTVSVISGNCGDLGVAVMLATDYRVASEGAHLTLLDNDGSILPGMVLHRLANQIGFTGSRRIALFGMQVDVAKALELGLVDETGTDPEAAATTFVKSLCPSIARDLSVRRRLLLDASALNYDDGLGTHLAACDRLLRAAAQRAETSASQRDAVAVAERVH